MLNEDFCRNFGIGLPIWNAGMGGGLAGVELAAAVCNAGGLGVLGMGGLPVAAVREHIQRLRAKTHRPFGVNLIAPLMSPAHLACCLEERVPVLILFWADPGPLVEQIHAAGSKLVVQVGSVAQARAAANVGVDAVIIQGLEAGGHNRGTLPLSIALPETVDALAPLPVIAAGGIADQRGVAAAFQLGAQAVSPGTRFLCSNESRAAMGYKQCVLAARAEDTLLTELFDLEWPHAAHRVLRNRVVQAWEAAGSPPAGRRPGEGDVVGTISDGEHPMEITRYSTMMPLQGFTGNLEDQALYCGQSCALIDDILPAATIVRSLATGAN